MRLPEFWQFLEPGWWIVHLFATAIVYMLGMGHGRRLAERERRRREAAGGDPAGAAPPAAGERVARPGSHGSSPGTGSR